MKKLFFFLLVLLTARTVIAQDDALKPSGNVITRDVAIKPFNAIKANGLYELILTQGDRESVKVETDDNLQSLIVVSNEGNTLVIDEPRLRDHSFRMKNREGEHDKKQRFKVFVTFKDLKDLDVQTIGNVRSEGSLTFDGIEINDQSVGNIDLNITATKLILTNKGVGSVTLIGKADHAVITNSGVGSFKGGQLIVQTMHINNSGVGHANVNVVKDLSVRDSFLGKVSNEGPAKAHKMDNVEI